MRTTRRFVSAAAFALVFGAGCGGEEPGGSSAVTTRDGVATYRVLTAQVDQAARAYRADMAATGQTSTGQCRKLHAGYFARVQPWLTRLARMSPGLDALMARHGGRAADTGCVAALMGQELEHHHAVACNASSLGADRAEVDRHVQAMLSYGDHLDRRCGQLLGGLDSGRWSWTPAMHGCGSGDDDDGDDHGPGGMMMHGGMMHGGMMHGSPMHH